MIIACNLDFFIDQHFKRLDYFIRCPVTGTHRLMADDSLLVHDKGFRNAGCFITF